MTEQQLLNRLLNSFSYNNSGIIGTSYKDDGVVSGNGFVLEHNITIGSAATLYVLVDYTTYVTTEDWQKGEVYIYPPEFATTFGPVQVHIYRGTDYAGGSEILAINPNTLASKSTSGTTWTTGATGTTKGNLVLSYLVGTESTAQDSGGGTQTGLSFFIRPNTSKTLVEIVNESGSEITLHYGQLLFEI